MFRTQDVSLKDFLDLGVSPPDIPEQDVSRTFYQNVSHPDFTHLAVLYQEFSHPDFSHQDFLDLDVSHPDFLFRIQTFRNRSFRTFDPKFVEPWVLIRTLKHLIYILMTSLSGLKDIVY